MSDVTIPAAEWSRISQFVRTWARRDNPLKDLVEKYDPPKPRTLRDEAIAALDCGLSSYEEYADAVLAVIADEADVLVLKHPGRGDLTAAQFVAWLRGEQP